MCVACLGRENKQPVRIGIGKRYGWRTFNIGRDGFLISPAQFLRWKTAQREATCARPVVHPHDSIPDLECGCGFYIYNTFKEFKEKAWFNASIVALCSVWGGIVEHEVGCRAQFLKIEHVWYTPKKQQPSMLAMPEYESITIHKFISTGIVEAFERAHVPARDVTWIPEQEADIAPYTKPPKLERILHDEPGVLVQYGVYQTRLRMTETTECRRIRDLRKKLADLWAVPLDATSYKGQVKVCDEYVMQQGDQIFFYRRSR